MCCRSVALEWWAWSGGFSWLCTLMVHREPFCAASPYGTRWWAHRCSACPGRWARRASGSGWAWSSCWAGSPSTRPTASCSLQPPSPVSVWCPGNLDVVNYIMSLLLPDLAYVVTGVIKRWKGVLDMALVGGRVISHNQKSRLISNHWLAFIAYVYTNVNWVFSVSLVISLLAVILVMVCCLVASQSDYAPWIPGAQEMTLKCTELLVFDIVRTGNEAP